MSAKTVVIAEKPQVCWRAFVEVETLCAWVPGLRRVQLLTRATNGMPAEVHFEFAEARTYTLVYSYEDTHVSRIVGWVPRAGARDAVSGSARFEACDEGTLLTYELVHGEARSHRERYIDNTDELLAAFARWIEEARR